MCDTSEYVTAQVIGFILVFVYPVGTPLLWPYPVYS